MEEAIRLENVYKIYRIGKQEVKALDGISFSIKKGDYISIMGPSGSGKSTLLNLIGCLDKPTEGEIFIDGVNIFSLNDDELTIIRRDRIGFIFQKFNLIPTLTALENVELPMIFNGGRKREKAIKLLEMVGIGDKINSKPAELSGGQQQRVAIARALANNPSIILADEPTGNLDSRTGSEIMNILEDLNKRGRTIVMVTHDPSIAEYSEKIIKIRDGRINVF
ncbi:lipoprotein-releasing system ATP-binding protein LolD [Archaeoglobales archaeon]|nr:MAG: lipoprotein-releasing system ATP-binding protein LolD [Archaeoglobales archaeon]